MKAIKLEGAMKLKLLDLPKPEPDGHNVIIKVDKCCICGSDFHFSYEEGDTPRLKDSIPGHEYAGLVVDPGANDKLKAGDRVVVNPSNTCDHCELCKTGHGNACAFNAANTQGCAASYPGAFAEYTAARPDYVLKIEDGCSMVNAALIEPFAVAARSIKLSGLRSGDNAVVFGCGMTGVATCLLAKASGASKIALIDINMERAALLLENGDVDAVFNGKDPNLVRNVLAFNGGEGYKKLFECAGAVNTLNTAAELAAPNAQITVTGTPVGDVPLNSGTCCLKELSFNWVYAYDYADFLSAKRMLEFGAIHPERYVELIDMEDVVTYYEKLRAHRVVMPKVVIDIARTGANA